MVTLERIRRDMKDLYSVDNELHYVDVNADTIDEALEDAAVQLDTKVSNLNYEVIEKGSDGFLKLGKKPWKLRIYQDPSTIKKTVKLASEGLFDDKDISEAEEIQNKDGLYFVRHFGSDIMLKVIVQSGNGEPVDIKDVEAEVKRQDTIEFDENLIRKYVKHGTNGQYEKIGLYKHVPAGDVLIAVDITKDEMSASIIVSPPSLSGQEASAESIKRALFSQGVIEQCFNEEKINEFVDSPVYDIPFEVAHAIMPKDGHDAYISYNFETDPTKLKASVSEQGNVNYKKLNKIQNVIADQPLAQKIPAERGKGGKTLLGRYLEAKNGKDIPILLGTNVRLDRDGLTIKAEIDGEVMLINGRVCVEPVKYVDAVNLKTGDIKFVGTVIIKGNVEDGYQVEATNIEVNGIVDRSRLIATGNIVVHQGIYGKGEGYIKAGKSLWAKFINDCTVEVEENVVANDSIINCLVTAMKNIVVRGKKAQITGGHLLATEEISAKRIGSPGGGTETILEVGIDPRAKRRLEILQKSQTDLTKEQEKLELDIQNLEQTKKRMKKLSLEKQEKLDRIKKRNNEVDSTLAETNEEIEKIQNHLRELKAVGKVKIEDTIYAGVKVYVRDALDEVKMDTKHITIYYDNVSKLSKRGDWEPPSKIEEPDGYTAN